jgi:crotonobetainyl-CoA:carnitine CoA-transferase CaiB-like acyl-CoA transferase
VAGPYAGQEVPTREGDGADFQVLPCVDGWIAFVYLPGEFDSVRRMVGDPALDDPRFATVASRRAHIRAIIEIVRPWLAERTRAEINAHAQACGVPIGPVFSPRELLEDDQYVHGKFITEVAGTAGGLAFRTPGSPATVNGQRLPLAPRTRVTLEDVLGERA